MTSARERLQLARAVSDDVTVRYLNAENEAAGYAELGTAVHSGRAYFVHVKPNILALDADHSGSGEAASAINKIAALVRAHNIEPVIVASGQPGRLHLFARVEEVDLRQNLEAIATGLKIDARRSIRPPLTPHRSGRQVRLVAPPRAAAAVLALTKPASVLRGLSRTMQQAVLHGSDRYASNSELMSGIALAALNAGWTFEDFMAAVHLPDTYTSMYLDSARVSSGDPDAGRWLQRTWDAALDYFEANPPKRQDSSTAISNYRAQAMQRKWQARTKATDQAVYLAVIAKAELAGTTTNVNLSIRETADMAGVSKGTAGKALRRLVEMGLISRHQRPTANSTHADRWDLVEAIHPPVSHPLPEVGGSQYDPAHDLWRYGVGLGKTSGRIWDALQESPKSVKELSHDLNVCTRTVKNAIGRLTQLDLLVAEPDNQFGRVIGPDLDQAARRVGANGRGARQAQQHRAERAHWKSLLDRAGEMHWEPSTKGQAVGHPATHTGSPSAPAGGNA